MSCRLHQKLLLIWNQN